jgi:diguanylate cyclase (GGDEF)-like protein
MRTRKLGTTLVLAHVPALIVAVVVALVVQRALEDVRETDVLRNRSAEAIAHSNEFLRAVVEAETGQRGFVITGLDAFLEPYHSAVIVADLATARTLAAVADEPLQADRVKRARALFERWRVEHAAPTVAARRTSKEAAEERVMTGRGKALVDQIRDLIELFVQEEGKRQATRMARSRRAADEAAWIAFVGPLIAFVVTLPLSLFVALQVARSLERLATVAARLATGELGHRARVERNDEVGTLAGAINTMAEKIDARSLQNQRLGDLGQMLQASLNTEEACKVFAGLAAAILQAPVGSVAFFNASRNLLSPQATWGVDALPPEPFAAEDCWALRRGRVHHPRSDGDFRCAHLARTGWEGGLCVPMIAQGDTLGVLTLCPGGPYSEELVTLAESVGERFGLTIANLRLRDRLRDQSIRDALTGLFNRRYLEETLARELDRAERTSRPLGLLVIDIDHFKRLNDTYGHDAGDAALAEVGRLLGRSFRSSDIACRYGGEEFVVVLPEAARGFAATRADSLRQAVKELRLNARGAPIQTLSVSIGVAHFPDDGRTPEDLVRAADVALYAAKEQGRDRVVVASTAVDAPVPS